MQSMIPQRHAAHGPQGVSYLAVLYLLYVYVVLYFGHFFFIFFCVLFLGVSYIYLFCMRYMRHMCVVYAEYDSAASCGTWASCF